MSSSVFCTSNASDSKSPGAIHQTQTVEMIALPDESATQGCPSKSVNSIHASGRPLFTTWSVIDDIVDGFAQTQELHCELETSTRTQLPYEIPLLQNLSLFHKYTRYSSQKISETRGIFRCFTVQEIECHSLFDQKSSRLRHSRPKPEGFQQPDGVRYKIDHEGNLDVLLSIATADRSRMTSRIIDMHHLPLSTLYMTHVRSIHLCA